MDLDEATGIISKCVEASTVTVADSRLIIQAWQVVVSNLVKK